MVRSDRPPRAGEPTPHVTALVIAWSADEPSRVGEVAIVPEETALTVGRGAGQDGTPRLRFFRQRPGVFEATGPLASPALSREHALVRSCGEGLAVERVGRAPMRVDGRPCDSASIDHGSVLQLGREMLLVCVRRPATISALRFFPRDAVPSFGEPDVTDLLGESPGAWKLRESIAFAAKAASHLLVAGESGTGKELTARAVHRFSARATHPFVARNAATLPAGLVDAELFGNARNYPNPGMTERSGLVGEADGGVLFLDEIGELPSELQAHLLRVLDAGGEYQRLGESTTRRSDFILVGATNRGPGALKPDLAARLVSRIEVPSLTSRLEDIPLLASSVLLRAARRSPELASKFVQRTAEGREVARMAPELVEHLLRRSYTTHTREIEAILWRAIEKSRGDTLEAPEELPDTVTSHPTRKKRAGGAPTASAIRDALRNEGGNVARAAAVLSLSSRYALYRLMKRHGIEADDGSA